MRRGTRSEGPRTPHRPWSESARPTSCSRVHVCSRNHMPARRIAATCSVVNMQSNLSCDGANHHMSSARKGVRRRGRVCVGRPAIAQGRRRRPANREPKATAQSGGAEAQGGREGQHPGDRFERHAAERGRGRDTSRRTGTEARRDTGAAGTLRNGRLGNTNAPGGHLYHPPLCGQGAPIPAISQPAGLDNFVLRVSSARSRAKLAPTSADIGLKAQFGPIRAPFGRNRAQLWASSVRSREHRTKVGRRHTLAGSGQQLAEVGLTSAEFGTRPQVCRIRAAKLAESGPTSVQIDLCWVNTRPWLGPTRAEFGRIEQVAEDFPSKGGPTNRHDLNVAQHSRIPAIMRFRGEG